MEWKCKTCGKSISPRYPHTGYCHSCAIKGSRHPQFKGRIYRMGYVYVFNPEHPHSSKQGYIAFHRVKMEKYIGRMLIPEEVVHHTNLVKDDNRINNLELLPNENSHAFLHTQIGDRKRERELTKSKWKKRHGLNV